MTTDLLPLLKVDAETLTEQDAWLSEEPVAPAEPRPARRKSPTEVLKNPKLMIVDDEPINVKVVQKYLIGGGFGNFVTTGDPTRVVPLIHEERPDVILLDIMMPCKSGLEILDEIRRDDRIANLPVIILTAASDQETKIKAIDLGATDFLTKPVEPIELMPRVRNALVVKSHHDHLRNYADELEREVSARTIALKTAQVELIHCLARAAEYRDDDTGQHVRRVGRFAELIALALGIETKKVELIAQAAPLHDIGKIGIPDSILLKPGKLDADEIAAMQRHCGYGKNIVDFQIDGDELRIFREHADKGARLLAASSSPVLQMAARIALTHHERWDGTGYPLGLSGEDIPIEGRITAVADVFDALSSRRPYKPAFPLDKCLAIMEEGRGTHFDPDVLDAFMQHRHDIIAVQCELADVD